MSSKQSSNGPHEQTLSYYEANAERFVENTRDIDMDSIYDPFLSPMVELASHHIGCPVLHLSFDQVRFRERFDGVWASASLLHVPRRNMVEVLEQLGIALKAGGVMYASFKYGEGETIRDGRLFNDYDEERLRDLLPSRPELRIIEVWRTTDLRPERNDVTWLNVLLRKR